MRVSETRVSRGAPRGPLRALRRQRTARQVQISRSLRRSSSHVSSVSRFAFPIQLAAFLAFCVSIRCVSNFSFGLNSRASLPMSAAKRCVSGLRFQIFRSSEILFAFHFLSCVSRFEFAFRCVFRDACGKMLRVGLRFVSACRFARLCALRFCAAKNPTKTLLKPIKMTVASVVRSPV